MALHPYRNQTTGDHVVVPTALRSRLDSDPAWQPVTPADTAPPAAPIQATPATPVRATRSRKGK